MAKRVLPDGWQPVDVHPRDKPGWQPGDPLPVGYNSTNIGHKQPGDPPGHNNKSSSTWHERRTDGGDGAGGGSKGGRRVGKMRRRDRPGLMGVIEWASSIISTLTGMVRQ